MQLQGWWTAAPLLPPPQPRCTGAPCPWLPPASEGAVEHRRGGRPLLPTVLPPLPSLGQAPCMGSGPHSSPSPSYSQAFPPNLVHMSAPLGLSDGMKLRLPAPLLGLVAAGWCGPLLLGRCAGRLHERTALCEALQPCWPAGWPPPDTSCLCTNPGITAELRAGQGRRGPALWGRTHGGVWLTTLPWAPLASGSGVQRS